MTQENKIDIIELIRGYIGIFIATIMMILGKWK